MKYKKLNKSLLKRLSKLNNKEILTLARAYKIENIINSTHNFQLNYNTMLFELRRRGMLKK